MKKGNYWIFLICIFLPSSVFSQNRTFHFNWPREGADTINVFNINDTIDIGTTSYTGSVIYDASIYNPTNDTFYYDDHYGNNLIVPPHDSGHWTIGLHTDYRNQDEGVLGVYEFSLEGKDSTYYNSVGSVHLYLTGRADIRIDKKLPLFQNQFWYGSLYSVDSSGGFYNFNPLDSQLFINDQDSDVVIQTIFIPKGSHFSIKRFSVPNFPVTLHNGDTFTTYLTYSDVADTIGLTYFPNSSDSTIVDTIYYDLVVIVTDTTYPVAKANYKGSPPKKELGQASVIVPNLIPANIFISNDPVTDGTRITIPETRSAAMKIVDLLGVTVAESNATDWRWNGESRSGGCLANGIYIIEARGISNLGKAFQVSKNIILMR